jgi:hypothetical protein
MNLGFSTHIKKARYVRNKRQWIKKPTHFVSRIKKDIKIHTIREDKKKVWKKGRLIHFATGVRTKNYKCFKKGVCTGTQKIEINYVEIIISKKMPPGINKVVKVNNRILSLKEIGLLAKNDGFDSVNDFFEWFNEDFKGKIIHWTDFRY